MQIFIKFSVFQYFIRISHVFKIQLNLFFKMKPILDEVGKFVKGIEEHFQSFKSISRALREIEASVIGT